jgi:hypothetical protein
MLNPRNPCSSMDPNFRWGDGEGTTPSKAITL